MAASRFWCGPDDDETSDGEDAGPSPGGVRALSVPELTASRIADALFADERDATWHVHHRRATLDLALVVAQLYPGLDKRAQALVEEWCNQALVTCPPLEGNVSACTRLMQAAERAGMPAKRLAARQRAWRQRQIEIARATEPPVAEEEPDGVAGVQDLPDDVLRMVLSALAPRDLARCMCVSRSWRRVASDGEWWRRITQAVAPYLSAAATIPSGAAIANPLPRNPGPWHACLSTEVRRMGPTAAAMLEAGVPVQWGPMAGRAATGAGVTDAPGVAEGDRGSDQGGDGPREPSPSPSPSPPPPPPTAEPLWTVLLRGDARPAQVSQALWWELSASWLAVTANLSRSGHVAREALVARAPSTIDVMLPWGRALRQEGQGACGGGGGGFGDGELPTVTPGQLGRSEMGGASGLPRDTHRPGTGPTAARGGVAVSDPSSSRCHGLPLAGARMVYPCTRALPLQRPRHRPTPVAALPVVTAWVQGESGGASGGAGRGGVGGEACLIGAGGHEREGRAGVVASDGKGGVGGKGRGAFAGLLAEVDGADLET